MLPRHNIEACQAGLQAVYERSAAFDQHIKGPVVLRLELTDTGDLQSIRLVKGIDPFVDEIVMQWLEANQECKFEPAICKDGRPCPYVISAYTISFDINKSAATADQSSGTWVLNKNIPAFKIRKDKLGGENPHLPDVIKAQRRGTTVSGSYKICIDTSGHVSTVSPVGSIPHADEPIMSTLRGWTYKPQAVPVCFIENFQFIVE